MKADSKASIRFEAFCLGGEECLNDNGGTPAGLGWIPPQKRFDTRFENVAECSIKLCRERVHDKTERRSVGRSVCLLTAGTVVPYVGVTSSTVLNVTWRQCVEETG